MTAQADTIKRVESTMASECQHAELRAVKSSALELRQSYKDGLRDGASLSSGKGVTSADSSFTSPP